MTVHPQAWGTSLEGLRVEMLDTARGPIEVAKAGEGPAVLLVHGTPGSWRQAISLAEDIASCFTVLLVSRPGYGATPVSTGRTFVQQADAFAAALDALGIEGCAVVGISGGGPSAIAFAEKHHERTRALVLVCALAAHMIRPPTQMRILLRIPGLGEAVSALTRSLARKRVDDPRSFQREAEKNLTPDEMLRRAEDPSMAKELTRFALSHLDAPPGLAGLRNDLAQIDLARGDGLPDLSEIVCSTLILHGDTDPTVPLEQAQFHADAIKGAQLGVYEQAGHVFLFTRRAEATQRILEFLRGTDGTNSS